MSVKNRFPDFFINARVLDCGSLDINGNNRYLFEDCKYTGIDIGDGPNVDIVTPIHKHQGTYDTVISTECLEHDRYISESIANMEKMAVGCLLITCATHPRMPHGVTWRSPTSSPFTNDYYRNVTPMMIFENIDLSLYSYCELQVNAVAGDLYFFAVKK